MLEAASCFLATRAIAGGGQNRPADYLQSHFAASAYLGEVFLLFLVHCDCPFVDTVYEVILALVRKVRDTEFPILIFPEIVWNRASESRPHGIPKKFRCGHWTKGHCAIDDESLVVFFDNIETFQLVTLNFSLPSQ
ncbi:MAG: hypothetical protein QOF56_2241 [Acidobacteriaceae bacterium]|nr:hypothetical protein [Acidobacteriaceae bacterium]